RHARRLLQERAAAKQLSKEVRKALCDRWEAEKEVTRKLRILWALHSIGDMCNGDLVSLVGSPSFAQRPHPEEALRAWGVRLIAERSLDKEMRESLVALAKSESSPRVRLALAAALPRLPLKVRWRVAEGLLAKADKADPNEALMLWYGCETLV